jgi:Tfp pilus assembly protein PilX
MSPRREDRDAGAALLLALLAVVLLAALGGGLIALGDTEATLAANHRAAAELLYAAEAAVERALSEMRAAATWTEVLTGVRRSALYAATAQPVAPWGAMVDLAALTTALQAESDATAMWGLNNPSWRRFASGSLDVAAGNPPGVPQAYLVVWVADDPSEVDNDPSIDTNDTVLVRGLAVNAADLRVSVQGTVRRVGGASKILAWRLAQ